MVNTAAKGEPPKKISAEPPETIFADEKYIKKGVRLLFAIASANPKYGLKLPHEIPKRTDEESNGPEKEQKKVKEQKEAHGPEIILPTERFSKKVVDIIKEYTLVSITGTVLGTRIRLKTTEEQDKTPRRVTVERLWLTIFFVCALARTKIAYAMRDRENSDGDKRRIRDELLNWVKKWVEYYTDCENDDIPDALLKACNDINNGRGYDVSSKEKVVYKDIALLLLKAGIHFYFRDAIISVAGIYEEYALDDSSEMDTLVDKVKSIPIQKMAKLGATNGTESADTPENSDYDEERHTETLYADDQTVDEEHKDSDDAAKKKEAAEAAEAAKKKEAMEAAADAKKEAAKKKEATAAAKKKAEEAAKAAEAAKKKEAAAAAKKEAEEAAKKEAAAAKKKADDEAAEAAKNEDPQSILMESADEASQDDNADSSTDRVAKKKKKIPIAVYKCEVPNGLIDENNYEKISISSLDNIRSYSTIVVDGANIFKETGISKLQNWLKEEGRSLVVVNGANEDEDDSSVIQKQDVLRIAQNTGKCIWHDTPTDVLLISRSMEDEHEWQPDAQNAGLVGEKWNIKYHYTEPERVIVAYHGNKKLLQTVLAKNTKEVLNAGEAGEAGEADEADEYDVLVADTIASLENIINVRDNYHALVLIGDDADKKATEKWLRNIATNRVYDDGATCRMYKSLVAHGKISKPVYVIALDITHVGCLDAGLFYMWEDITNEDEEEDEEEDEQEADEETRVAKKVDEVEVEDVKKGSSKKADQNVKKGPGKEGGEEEKEGGKGGKKERKEEKVTQGTLVVVPNGYDPKTHIVPKVLKELSGLIDAATDTKEDCTNAHRYDTVVIFHTNNTKQASAVKIPEWESSSKINRIFWYGDFKDHSKFSDLLPEENWVVHASRQEKESVIFYANKNNKLMGGEKWTRVSSINLAKTHDTQKPNESIKKVEFCEAGGATELHVVLQIAEPSDQAMAIRKQGIRAAMDYVSFLYGNDTSAGKKSAMCTSIDAISPLQQLVYLTLRPSSAEIKAGTRFARLYSLAPGSGKTRAMALALFDARRRDVTETICVILTNKNVRDHLMDEIIRTMKVGKEALIDLKASYANGEEVENNDGKEYWYNVMYSHLGTKKDYIEARDEVYKETIKLLDAKKIKVLLLDDLKASAAVQSSDAVTSAAVVVADECHEILSSIDMFTSCTTFYGFSATPFLENGNRAAVSKWVNKGKGLTNDDFVKENVCLASGRDVRAFLPYAKLEYKLRFATCSAKLPVHMNDVHTIRVTTDDETKESEEEEVDEPKEKKAKEPKPKTETYKDYNQKLDDEEYEAAIEHVLGEIRGNTRSYVYIDEGMIKLFRKVVSDKNNTLEKDQKIALINGINDLTGSSIEPRRTIFVDEGDKKDTIALRNVMNADPSNTMMAVVTTSYHSVQYTEMNATYIVGFPYDARGPAVDKCIQARNRAFRMCGHANTGTSHPIHYVLVERDGLMRGAYALAMVHPDKQQDSNIDAHRLVVSMRNVNKTVLHGTIEGDTGTIGSLIAKHKLVVVDDQSEKRARTIFDLYTKLREQKAPRVVSYDDRIIRAIHRVLEGKNATVIRGDTGTKTEEFDSGADPAPAHHDLRGLRFTLVSESDYTDIIKSKPENSLVLDYDSPALEDSTAELVHSLSKTGLLVVKRPCSSYTVYVDVTNVYYRRADKIQCVGQARYECFRVFPRDAKRFFVGTQKEFDHFVDLISGRDIYNKPCSESENGLVTPMMIAIAAKRELLKNKKVKITVSQGEYRKELRSFLERALGPWGTQVSEDPEQKEIISIEIEDAVIDQKKALQIQKKIYTLNEAQLVQSQEAQVDNSKKTKKKQQDAEDQTESKEDQEPKKHTEAQEEQVLKKERYAKGTLVVFESNAPYEQSKLGAISDYEWLGMVDIRNKGPYKSRLGDITNVRCTKAVFLTEKSETKIEGYAAARIVADKYVMESIK
jgi:hypothetical protein